MQELDLTVRGRYADGKPKYVFHTSFPGGVKVTPPKDTKEEAFEYATTALKAYTIAYYPGGMGSVYGVARRDNGWVGVYQTYYSNT